MRTNTSPPDHLAHWRAPDGSELRVVCGQFLHRSRETGGAWVPVPMLALADVFTTAADEYTCDPGESEGLADLADSERTDSGYDTAAEAKSVCRAMASALVEFW